MGKLKYSERLQQAIGFTDEDLQANRAGILSERQRKYFYLRRTLWVIVGLFAMSGCIVGGASYFMQNELQNRAASIIWILASIFAAFVLVVTLRELLNISYILRKNQALSLRGTIKRHVEGTSFTGRFTPLLTVEIHHTKVPVSFEQYEAFKQGDPYIIYYAPHTKKLLSAEWLREIADPFE